MVPDSSTKTTPSVTELPEAVRDLVLDYWAQVGRTHVIPVQGKSMQPFMREGDQVKVRHGQEGLRRGDIVAYQLDGTLIIHRLLKQINVDAETHYLMKGDNATAIDPAVPASKILGCAVALQRTHQWRRLDTFIIQSIGWGIAMTTLARQAILRRVKQFIYFLQ